MWCQLAGRAGRCCGAIRSTRRFGLGRGMTLAPPSAASLAALLRLGVPMGLSMLVEVTGFTFMAFFISRIGATAGGRPPDRRQHGVDDVHAAAGDRQRDEHAGRAAASAPATAPTRAGSAGHGLEIGVGVAAVLGGAVYLLREQVVGLYTARPGDRRRGAAAAGLGRAVPRRRRGADGRRVRAARLAHRTVPLRHLRRSRCGASASAAATSLAFDLGRHQPGVAARRARLLVDGDARPRRSPALGMTAFLAREAAPRGASARSRSSGRGQPELGDAARPPAGRSRSSCRRRRAPRSARCRRGARRSA